MIKVSRYFSTLQTEAYENFILESFSFDMLCQIKNNNQALFDCWRGKDMVSWMKYTNDNNIVLEVFPDYYNIKKNNKELVHALPHPTILNDFIEDMIRFKIQLYWSITINENFEPKDYLDKKEIKSYYVNLLKNLNKGYELD